MRDRQDAHRPQTVSTEQEQFRILSIRELRSLSSEQRADYLGRLAAHNLQEEAGRAPTPTPSPERFDEREVRARGTLAGIAAVAAAWMAIYIAYIYLRSPFADELASAIAAVAGLAATRLLSVVRDRYVSRERRRNLRQESPPPEAGTI